jgi:hypothetical protein
VISGHSRGDLESQRDHPTARWRDDAPCVLGVCVLSGIVWVALFAPMRDGVTAPSSVTGSARAEKGDGGDPEARIAAWQKAGGRIPSALDDPLGARPDPVATIGMKGSMTRMSSVSRRRTDTSSSTFGGTTQATSTSRCWLARSSGRTRRSCRCFTTIRSPCGRRRLPPVDPDLPGPVRIVEGDGMTLIVESTQTGQRVSFDVRDRTFRPA